MLEFLNRPYPFSFQPSRRIKQLLPIGLCVFAFLILFKPFGLINDPDLILSAAYFSFSGTLTGLITTVIIPYLFPTFFDESKWTLKRNLIWSACIYFIFATLMFLAYNVYDIYRNGANHHLNFTTYLWWIYINLIFGVPLGIIVNLVNQYYLLKRHLKIAENINKTIETTSQDSLISILEFEVDKFNKVQLEVSHLIYVEALGNYVNVAYNLNGFKKIAIRETISNIEQKIGESNTIFKPHRSYLVNLQYIKKVIGDSQGLKIHLKGYDKVIPVSRNKIKEFRSHYSARL
jgi:hypothetical protein